MCGRYYVEISEDELRDIIAKAEEKLKNEPEQMTFTGGEIFPSNVVPVVTGIGDAQFMKWGFPAIAQGRPPLINARSETALTSRTFRDAMEHSRCLIPATAYYEWKDIGKNQKEKYEFALIRQKPFFMAGRDDADEEHIIVVDLHTEIKPPVIDASKTAEPLEVQPVFQWWISVIIGFAAIAIIVTVIIVSRFTRMMKMK